MIIKKFTAELLLVLVLLLHLVLLITITFTLWPEMVVYPYLLNNNFKLYTEIINPYMPALTYALGIFSKIFGTDPNTYRILSWIYILLIDIVIYFICAKLTNKKQAVISASFFALISIPFHVNGLWFDLVQTPFVLLSCYFFHQFLKKQSSNDLLKSSLFLTTAFFIKQQIAWLSIFLVLYALFKLGRQTLPIAAKNAKALLPFSLVFLIHVLFFMQKGTLSDFLFWTVYFPFLKASSLPGYVSMPTARQILPIASLVLLFLPLLMAKKENLKFFALCAAATLPFAYPRFDYFHLIPAVALLSLVFPKNLQSLKSQPTAKASLAIGAFLLFAFSIRYFQANITNQIRFFEKDIYQAAQQLERSTQSSDVIYIQNGPDQLLPLASRLPTRPWADEFPWYLEIEKVQKDVLEGIKNQNPPFVVFKPYEKGPKYQIGAYAPQSLANYLDNNYKNDYQLTDTLWLKVKK